MPVNRLRLSILHKRSLKGTLFQRVAKHVTRITASFKSVFYETSYGGCQHFNLSIICQVSRLKPESLGSTEVSVTCPDKFPIVLTLIRRIVEVISFIHHRREPNLEFGGLSPQVPPKILPFLFIYLLNFIYPRFPFK